MPEPATHVDCVTQVAGVSTVVAPL
jgi:hypothetical protein